MKEQGHLVRTSYYCRTWDRPYAQSCVDKGSWEGGGVEGGRLGEWVRGERGCSERLRELKMVEKVEDGDHRLNMELDVHSLLGLHVT
jgi:hypothetical protein